MDPLLRAPFPKPGEHFGSWIRRLAAANDEHSLAALAKRLGLASVTPLSTDRAWRRLAEATGIEAERIEHLRLRTSDPGRHQTVSFGSTHVQTTFLDHAHLRSCPACLARDGWLPQRFSLRQTTACAEHGIRLEDACACGRKRRIFDRQGLWDCPACGAHPSRLSPEPADPREILISRLLEGQPVDGMPGALADEPLSARAAVVERLGRLALLERDDAARPGRYNLKGLLPDGVPKNRTLQDDRETALAAADMLADWPANYHALLDRLTDRHPKPGAKDTLLRHFSSEAGRIAIRSFVDHDGRIVAFAEEARLDFLRDRIGWLPARKALLGNSNHFEAMPGTLHRTVDIFRNTANFVMALEFAQRLHVGDRSRIEAWFEAEIIRTVRHVDGSILLARSEFDELLARVNGLLEGDGEAVDYIAAAKLNNLCGSYYRQRFFFEDVLAGRIRTRSANDGSEGMRSRLLNRVDFERRRWLCKTATQIMRDEFTQIQDPSFVKALWGMATPARSVLAELGDKGTLRFVQSATSRRYAIRDVVDLVQRETGRILLLTDHAVGDLKDGDWRSVLVQDSL